MPTDNGVQREDHQRIEHFGIKPDEHEAIDEHVHPAPQSHGRTRPADLSLITLAKWTCGKGHRIHPARLS
jgi:hypothetical protein